MCSHFSSSSRLQYLWWCAAISHPVPDYSTCDDVQPFLIQFQTTVLVMMCSHFSSSSRLQYLWWCAAISHPVPDYSTCDDVQPFLIQELFLSNTIFRAFTEVFDQNCDLLLGQCTLQSSATHNLYVVQQHERRQPVLFALIIRVCSSFLVAVHIIFVVRPTHCFPVLLSVN